MLSQDEIQQAQQQYNVGGIKSSAQTSSQPDAASFFAPKASSLPTSPTTQDQPQDRSIVSKLYDPLNMVGRTQSAVSGISNDLGQRITNIAGEGSKVLDTSKPFNARTGLEAGWNTGGELAGGALDVIKNIVGNIPGAKTVMGAAGQEVKNMKDVLNKGTAGGVDQITQAMEGWAQKHPQAYKDLQSLGNVAQVATLGGGGEGAVAEGADITKPLVEGATTKVGDITQPITSGVGDLLGKGKDLVTKEHPMLPELQAHAESIKAKGGPEINVNDKSFQDALKQTAPSKAEQKSLIEEGQAKTKDVGLGKKTTYVPSEQDVKIANETKDIIKDAKTPQARKDALTNTISTEGKALSGDLQKKEWKLNSDVPATKDNYVKQYKEYLDSSIKPSKGFSGDQSATFDRAKAVLVDKFDAQIADHFEKQPDGSFKQVKPVTADNLWSARKSFSKEIENVFDKADSTQRRAKLAAYDAGNNLIKNIGGSDVSSKFDRWSNLFEGGDRLGTTNSRRLGTTAVTRWMSDHPFVKKVGNVATRGLVDAGVWDVLDHL